MKNLDITDKEIVWNNDTYAIIIADDLNYDILEKKTSVSDKDDPNKNIKIGDVKTTWRSIPCYSSTLIYVVKNLISKLAKKDLKDNSLENVLNNVEKLYSDIYSKFNVKESIEYTTLKAEYIELLRKVKPNKE